MKLYLWDDVPGYMGDRSTGNRLYLWDAIQHLNSLNDFGFEIKVLEADYMWVKSGLVHLPNTSTYRQSEIFKDLIPTGTNWYQRSLLYENKTGIFNLNPHMTVEELLPYYHDGKKLPLKDILIKCNGFGPFKIFKGYLNGTPDQIEYNSPFIKDIHFNRELLQKTGDVAEDITMTVHLRRGSGCRWPDKYINEVMSEKSRKFFADKVLDGPRRLRNPVENISLKRILLDESEKGTPVKCNQIHHGNLCPLHKFYEDEVYFSIFDKIIAINSDAKICLVHDTFDEDYNHWFERYPKNLVTTRQLLNKEDFSDPILKNEEDDILRLFIDLLILLQTRFTVLPSGSTFSGFTDNYNYITKKRYYRSMRLDAFIEDSADSYYEITEWFESVSDADSIPFHRMR